jgi:hypothetical protein
LAEKKVNSKKTEGVSEKSENKKPSLKMRKKGDAVVFSIRNGGRAGRIFLLNEDGTFDKVVEADKFIDTWNSESVARSKKGLGDKATQYLSTKCKVAPEQKTDVIQAIKAEFTGILKLVQDGKLKKASKAEIEIIPLV